MEIRALLIGLLLTVAAPALADDTWSIYQHDMAVQFGAPAVAPPPVTVPAYGLYQAAPEPILPRYDPSPYGAGYPLTLEPSPPLATGAGYPLTLD